MKNPPTRDELIVASAMAGYTYDAIAKDFDISKQRVHQILKRLGLTKRIPTYPKNMAGSEREPRS